MKKLLVLGDSILKGVVYSESLRRHTMLPTAQRALNTILADAGIEVENHARFGATGDTVLHEAQKYLTGSMEDTTVLFGFGGNDSDHDWSAVAADPDGAHSPRTSPSRLRELHHSCVRLADSCGCRVLCANLVPIDAEKYFRWLSRGKDADAILRWLGDVSMLYRWHEDYNDRIAALCREENVPMVDLRQPFLLNHSFRELICDDGIHPTSRGYGLVDRAIADMTLSVNGIAPSQPRIPA